MRQQKFPGSPKLKVQSRGSGEKTDGDGCDWTAQAQHCLWTVWTCPQQSQAMAEMSKPILRLKEKQTQRVKSFPTQALPPLYVFETGFFFDWLSSLQAVQVVSLAGFASVDKRRSTLFSCNTCPRMMGKKKKGVRHQKLFHQTKCKSPEENSPPSQAPAIECKTLFPAVFSLLMTIDLLLCQVTEEATQPSPLSGSGGVAGLQQQVNLNKDMLVDLILSVSQL